MRFLKKKLLLKEIMKKVPSHPVTFYGENFEKQKCLELVTSSLSCKTCLQKFRFWSYPLYLETVEREGKKTTKD